MDQDTLRRLLNYSPTTGVFTWAITGAGRSKMIEGRVAGHIRTSGYCQIGISGKAYYGHRLAWMHVFGQFPEGQIDHKNGVKSDNRLNNLREASASENNCNVNAPAHNTTGTKNVSWDRSKQKWRARVVKNRKAYHGGYFKDKNAAIAKAKEIRLDNHGVFARV